jgi:cytochrome c biogenesis factor
VTVVGELALWFALFLAVWASVASFSGRAVAQPELVASGARSIVACALMTTLACVGLWTALLTHDFSLQYVASHTTLNTPALYLITAFWAGPPGAVLSFALGLSLCSAVVVGLRRPHEGTLPWAAGVLGALLAFVFAVACFVTNPYDRLAWVPAEGQGLDPRLQNPLAAPHYVATYGAFGAAAIPFARGLAAAVARDLDGDWFTSMRRWTVVTWMLLTASIGLRTRWTYLDPSAAAWWHADLAHLLSVGAWILGFVLLRLFAVRPMAPSPRLVAALALTAFCLVLAGAAAAPQPPRSEGAATPIEALLALVGFGLIAAAAIYALVKRLPRAVSGDGAKARRPPAVLVVYAGALVLVAGMAATLRWTNSSIKLRPGESAQLVDPYGRRWRFVSQGVSRDEGMNYLSTGVALEVWRDGRSVGIVSAERRQYLDSFKRTTHEPTVDAGVWTFLALDLYVTLAEVRGESAQLRVGFRPLAACIWIGWLVLAIGGVALGAGWGHVAASHAGVRLLGPV